MNQPTLYDRRGRSYRRWQVNEDEWPKPGMFRSWKQFWLAVGLLLGATVLFALIVGNLCCAK